MKNSSIKTHFRGMILIISFYGISGSFFKIQQVYVCITFDFVLTRDSLIKRHLWNLEKRRMEYPIILKKTIILVPSWFSTFYFSKTFTWSYSWKIRKVLLTSSFLKREKCSCFWKYVLILILERGGRDQNNRLSSET